MNRFPALQSRNFRLLWCSVLASNVGTWMQNTAQSWLIYKMAGNDPMVLGWLGAAFAFPVVVGLPLGGIAADRFDRRKLLYATQAIYMVLALVLAVLSALEVLRPWQILLATFLGGMLLAFDNPARQSLVVDLVPPEHLQNAVSLNSATFTGAALVGPAIAGALLHTMNASWIFLLNAISFVAVIAAIVLMRNLQLHLASKTPMREMVFGGFSYARRDALVGGLLALATLAALLGRAYPQLLPIFAKDVWHGGSRAYGALLSAGGGGALLGALALSSRKDIRRKGQVVLGSGACLCAAMIGFAFAPNFPIAIALLVVAGISATIFTTMISTVLQLRVPRALRGRVISLYVVTLIGMPYLGSLGLAAGARALASHGASASGAPSIVAMAAVALIAILVVAARSLLQGLDTDPQEKRFEAGKN